VSSNRLLEIHSHQSVFRTHHDSKPQNHALSRGYLSKMAVFPTYVPSPIGKARGNVLYFAKPRISQLVYSWRALSVKVHTKILKF